MNNDGDVEIPIEREETLPFPLVDKPITGTLNSGWNKVREKIENDDDEKTKTANKWKNIMDASKVFFGVDSDQSKSRTKTPIYLNKTLVNWNERTFKVMEKNRIFGGKLKKTALKDYIENLDENIVDEGDSYAFYKTTNRVLPRSKDNTSSSKQARLAKPVSKTVIKL